jgi:hypothetical protein
MGATISIEGGYTHARGCIAILDLMTVWALNWPYSRANWSSRTPRETEIVDLANFRTGEDPGRRPTRFDPASSGSLRAMT